MSTAGQRQPALRAVGPTCAHCGLEVEARELQPEAELQFCCSGCRQVYGLLHDWGLDGYYHLLARQGGWGTPAAISGRSFAELDDEGMLAEEVELTARQTHRMRLYLEGVHCAACVWLVEELPRAVDGLVAVRLNLANGVAEIEWDPRAVALSSVARALDGIGYTPHLRRQSEIAEARRAEDRSLLIRIGVATVCAMNTMFIHVALYAGEAQGMEARYTGFFRWLSLALAVPVVLFAAQPFFRTAWAGIVRRVPHVDLPIAIALASAFVFSSVSTVRGVGPVYFDSLAALVALLLGARYVQQRAQRAALERAEGLRAVAFVEFGRRLAHDGTSQEVPITALAPGDRVEVRSGDLIPVDGVVIAGRSSIDNAVLTGEPEPLAVGVGDAVFAGATNLGARLVVDVRAAGAETRIGGLLALVDEALSRRAPIVRLADRVSRWFVIAVLGLAAVAGLIGWLASDGDWDGALQRLIALLVVTCPCALGLATPVALSVGLSRGAGAGIFIKNPDAIELLERIDTVILDKTGTLTEGKPKVVAWHGSREARELAFALEAESAHPVAQAFRRGLDQPLRPARQIDGVRERPGLGIAGWIDGRPVAVGNAALMDNVGAQEPSPGLELDVAEEQLIAAGLSPIWVAVDGRRVGLAGVGDPLRPEAGATVAALLARGIRVAVLSGDDPRVVSQIATQIGLPLEAAHGAVSPEEKRDRVAALIEARRAAGRRGHLVMVGDGVNDAAALALADVGVAVHGGAGASLLAADVVLTRPGLEPLTELFTGSRRVLGIVRRNLVFSIAYNLVGASLALVGLVGPLLAAVMMPLSSLTVIGSSAVGRTFRQPRPRSPRRTEGRS